MPALTHPGADPACATCHGLGLTVAPKGQFAVAVPCACRAPRCPACRGTGFLADRSDPTAPVTRCACRAVQDRARRFDAAEIPARYANSTLDSFDPQLTGKPALFMLRKYVADHRPGEPNRGFILWGPVGRGKTHLAVGALRALIFQHGVSARFVEFSHLLADIKTTFGVSGAAAEVLRPLVECDILLIDELGKGRNTEFEGTVLDEIVSRRYNAGSTILGTTNYEPSAATGRATANLADPKRTQPTLPDRVGERVYSRLTDICDVVPVPPGKADDVREYKRLKARSRPRG